MTTCQHSPGTRDSLAMLGHSVSATLNSGAISNLMDLSGVEFEVRITKLLERIGFRTELTRATGDGGIDIVAVLDRPIVGVRYIVQCKRFGDKSPIGAPMIREFYGAFVSDRSAVKGLFITTSSFTAQAEEFARPLPIELIDGAKLSELLKEYLSDEQG